MGKYGFSVFVGNIGRRVRTEDIRDPFKKYGRVLDVDLKNGFGFVEFEDKRDAADAVKELNGLRVQGERITVEMSKGCRDKYKDFRESGRVRYRSFSKSVSPKRRRRSRSRSRGRNNERPHRTKFCVVVENLSSRISWAELKDLFRKAGRVTYTDAHDRLGKNKGEVCFESASDVKEAIKKFDGYELNGRDITVKKSDAGDSRERSRSRSRSRRRSRRSESHSPKRKSRSRSRSPKRKSRSRSPKRKSKSRKSESQSPKRKSRSRTPRKRSRTPRKRSRSTSRRRRSRSRSDSR